MEISKIIKTLENCNIQFSLNKQIIILRDDENCYEAQDVLRHLSN
jgi:hypothetical protein